MTPALLMQPELAADEVERLVISARDAPPARGRAGRRDWPPRIEKVDELGKARCEIVILPDIALQQHLMIRKAVDDFGRGQSQAFELTEESRVGHGPPACLLFLPRLKS